MIFQRTFMCSCPAQRGLNLTSCKIRGFPIIINTQCNNSARFTTSNNSSTIEPQQFATPPGTSYAPFFLAAKNELPTEWRHVASPCVSGGSTIELIDSHNASMLPVPSVNDRDGAGCGKSTIKKKAPWLFVCVTHGSRISPCGG